MLDSFAARPCALVVLGKLVWPNSQSGIFAVRKSSWVVSGSVLILMGLLTTAQAQEAPPALPANSPAQAEKKPQAAPELTHRFLDLTNVALFWGVAGGRTLDYLSSQHFRAKGINERLLSNRLVDNQPLFAAVEAAGTAGSIAVAYLLHRTGHHKIERWVSIIHISVGVGASVRNYLLKPDSPSRLPM
jgi:hypothetical protein